MGKKRQLKENVEIKLIVEKNLQLIDAMKKLNELLVQDTILKPQSDKSIGKKTEKPAEYHR